MNPQWITAICAVLVAAGGFITWLLSYFASKEQMKEIKNMLLEMQDGQKTLFSNAEEDRQERRKIKKLLEDVDSLFRTIQSQDDGFTKIKKVL